MALYKPTNDMEKSIVEEIFASDWRIRRLQTIEIALIDYEMLQTEDEIEKKLVHFDSGIHLGVSFLSLADKSQALSLLSRYESRLHRIRDRAFKRLLDGRKAAADALTLSAPEPAKLEPPAASPKTQSPPALQVEPAATPSSKPVVNASRVGQVSSPVSRDCRRNPKGPIKPTLARFLRRLRTRKSFRNRRTASMPGGRRAEA